MGITKIGLQNFRVFKEMQEIELAPITVFTGKNNSGKSSIIKALLLLNENAKKNSLTELDFSLGKEKHNLYDFENVLNNPNKDLIFNFTMKSAYLLQGNEQSADKEYKITYIYINSKLHRMILTEILKNKKDYKIIIDYDTSIKENIIDVNWFYQNAKKQQVVLPPLVHGYEVYSYYRDNLDNFPEYLGQNFFKSKLKKFEQDEVNNFIKEFHTNLLSKLIGYEFSLFEIDKKRSFFNRYKGKERRVKNIIHGNKYAEILSVTGDILITDIYDISKLKIIYDSLIGIIKLYIKSISRDIEFDYLEFHKTNFKRVYTNQTSESAFATILKTYFDFNVNEKIAKEEKEKKEMLIFKEIAKKQQKKEIEEFIKKGYKVKIWSILYGNSPVIDHDKKEVIFREIKEIPKLTETQKILEYINYWLGKEGFDIGEKIVLEKEKYSTVVKIIKDGREINIADLGSGTNQLLAILLKIINSKLSTRIIIEEPEVNLHPNLQSKLADMIVGAYKSTKLDKDISVLGGRPFLIETHSEYFIRRLQYLVAKKVIKPEDVAVYYFNDPKDLKEGEEQVINLKIREDGMTDKDFGSGFFDESVKLTTDLLKIQNFS